MDISLLNEDRLVALCILSSVLLTIIVLKQDRRWLKTRLPYHAVGSLLLGCIAWITLQHIFPRDSIPGTLVGWVALVVFSISIIFTVSHNKRRTPFVIVSAIITVLFSLSLANQYYQYFPTVGSLFDSNGLQTRSTLDQKTVFSTITPTRLIASVTEDAYIPPPSSPLAGTVTPLTIPGDISHFQARQEFIYMPPAALVPSGIKFPIVVVLSGVPGSPGDWIGRIQIESIMNDFATKHHGLAPIIVGADQTGGDGFDATGCVDSSKGNVETYLTQDIPTYLRHHFSVSDNPDNWAIGGISDGAMCSTMLGLRHPDVYRTFVSLSGETAPTIGSKQKTITTLFNNSTDAYNNHVAHTLLSMPNARQTFAQTAGRLVLGRDEQQSLIQSNRALFDQAKTINLSMTLELLPGHHSFGLWHDGFSDSLPWLSQRLQLTRCIDAQCTQ
jgi:enterochelin esterase-like enzyme